MCWGGLGASEFAAKGGLDIISTWFMNLGGDELARPLSVVPESIQRHFNANTRPR